MEFTSDVSVSRGSTQRYMPICMNKSAEFLCKNSLFFVVCCLSVSFYIYATGDVLFPLLNPTDPLTSDDNLSIVAVARGGDSGLWGDNSNEYSL